jgi:predicted RNA binding protein YcfA (HicA-like mRNA interferase family)
MSKLPSASGAQAIRAFSKAGFQPARQRGSHVVLKKDGYPLLLSVPLHAELKKGTLRALIADSGLTVAQFCANL